MRSIRVVLIALGALLIADCGKLVDTGAPTSANSSLQTGAIAFRSSSPVSSGNSTSIIITKPPSIQNGDVFIAHVGVQGDIAITAPVGWTLIRNDALSSYESVIYYHVVSNVSAEPVNYTWSWSGSYWYTGAIADYVNVNISKVVDASSGASMATASPPNLTVPSITTTSNNEMVLVFANVGNSYTVTFPNKDTIRWNAPDEGMADYIQTLAGSTGTQLLVFSGVQNVLGQQISLNPAN